MIRIRNTVASVLGALVVLGTCTVASAQTNTPDKTLTPQEQFDRDKVATKDRIQGEINNADANVDALSRLAEHDQGAMKKNGDALQMRISDLRDTLKNDLAKVDEATQADWPHVKDGVQGDLNALDAQLKIATNVTHLPLTGAASKQPVNP